MEIKVAVFDDNRARRTALQLLVDATDGITCVGVFEDCRDILTHVKSCKPDVVLMDINMPHVNGIQGVRLMHENFPDIKILMQTVFDDDEKIFDAICSGASGYFLKKTPPLKLIDGVLEVMQGGAPMSPSIASRILGQFRQQNTKQDKLVFDLSDREIKILSLLVEGLSYKMIAASCSISFSTVNTHVKNIYKKLQVHSAGEAVKKAIDNSIV